MIGFAAQQLMELEVENLTGGRGLTIPLILNEPVNIGEKRLLEHELRELLHKRLQSSLLHGWHELVVQTALTEQGMCSPLGGAGFEMFIEAESFAGGTANSAATSGRGVPAN